MFVRRANALLTATLPLFSYAFIRPPLPDCNLHHGYSLTKTCMTANGINAVGSNVVVISPPGGIGEVSAIEAAKCGASVRWFVISTDDDTSSSSSKVFFSEESLSAISDSGGQVELAGSEASALLIAMDDPQSAITAVSSWCGESDAIISCMDYDSSNDNEDTDNMWNAIKVAAKEASKRCTGVKIAVGTVKELEEELESDVSKSDDGQGLNVGQLLPSLLSGGRTVFVPPTLKQAMGDSVISLRHGELFGVPESSMDVSPFIGGPRRDPNLREEYTSRAIRLDPSISILANPNLQSQTRSSRLSVGAAAALLATKTFESDVALDICLASLRGSDALSEQEWIKEFQRVEENIRESGGSTNRASSKLFSADFKSVPSVERLTEWLATKWAPAILRTYDLAGIRVGARPVYAARVGDDRVEIVWQKLENFEPITVGKVTINVSETGLLAQRDSSNSGNVNFKPLKGEDIVIRSLVDAAAQAVEKGLAVKPTPAKKPKQVTPVVTTSVEPLSSVVSSGTIKSEPEPVPEVSSSAGPRGAGRRRSSERSRGKRRKKKSDQSDTDGDQNEPETTSDNWQ